MADPAGTDDTRSHQSPALLDTIAASTRPNTAATDGTLSRGDLVGRYVILRELGAGGMGVVYAAHDPDLDRKIALKILKPGIRVGDAQTRLFREAQSLARLAHPNVVAIYDVGTHNDSVWLAMELVQGQTLRDWFAKRRSWREVLAVMDAAGRGLAAAHAEGLLHRDFKPDNVMVGDDGRVRVMDFGLARTNEENVSSTLGDVETAVQPGVAALAAKLTQAGATMGTPAYMSPEQFRGIEITPASDQFSFCVTLWEALYGERPFEGNNVIELASNVLAGHIRQSLKRRGPPAWLRRLCTRGLRAEPNDRFPSMDRLLEALWGGLRRSRVRQWGLPLVVVFALGAGAKIHDQHILTQQAAACAEKGSRITGIWNEDARSKVRTALMGTGVNFAATTTDRVFALIDSYVVDWVDISTDTCVESEIRSALDADTADRVQWCLDEASVSLSELLFKLARASEDRDDYVIEYAVDDAASLPVLSRCSDWRGLQASPPPPESSKRQAVLMVKADIKRSLTLQGDSREESLRLAELARRRATALQWSPVETYASYYAGALSLEQKDMEGLAEATYMMAARQHQWELASIAAGALASYRVFERRFSEAETWLGHADFMAHMAGAQEREVLVLEYRSRIMSLRGRIEEARRLGRDAMIKAEALYGPDHPKMVSIGINVARLYESAPWEAWRQNENLRQVLARAFGSDHPRLAFLDTNMAVSSMKLGEYQRAEVESERALDGWRRRYGDSHRYVAMAMTGIAEAALAQGRSVEAITLSLRALGVYRRDPESTGTGVAGACFVLARALWENGVALPRAANLARIAAEVYRENPYTEKELGEVLAWQADHNSPE